jgi:hypothetical protein
MMIDQGLAPLSAIYRTFGAFPRTLTIKNKKSLFYSALFTFWGKKNGGSKLAAELNLLHSSLFTFFS